MARNEKFSKERGSICGSSSCPPRLGRPACSRARPNFSSQFGTLLYLGMQAAKVKNIMLIFARAPWHLMGGPVIQTAKDLRGKAIGIFSIGQANHYAAMRAIAHLGLDPAKDRQLSGPRGKHWNTFCSQARRGSGGAFNLSVAPPSPTIRRERTDIYRRHSRISQ